MSVRAFLASLAVLAVIGLLGELPVLGGPGAGSVGDYRGRWVLVNLWASWCVPCRQEAPDLDRFAQRYRERGVSVLGINFERAARMSGCGQKKGGLRLRDRLPRGGPGHMTTA